MLRNYIKVAFRNLWKSKGFSFINVFGLSIGLACCILIYLYVKEEFTFDKFHSKADRIYRAWTHEDYGENEVFFNTVTPLVLAPTLASHYPEIDKITRFNSNNVQIKKGNEVLNETVNEVGPQFFDIFDFPVLEGSVDGALENLESIILTENSARKYFGTDSPIGKSMEIQLGGEYRNFIVKAVLKNIPTNSSLQFDFLISDLHLDHLFSPGMLHSWTNVFGETYVLLNKSNDANALDLKFPSLIKEMLPDYKEGTYTIGLQPLTDIHLNPEMPAGMAPVADPKYSYILSAIAALILVVAAINFMTLSLGRSIIRAREVGIRKVAGAFRRQLVFQFLMEAGLVTVFSIIIGIGLALLGLPLFNDLAGKSLSINLSAGNFIFLFGLALLITFAAGSYPALILSGFRPISVLKNEVRVGGGKQRLRKILVIAQFVFSIFLISSTFIMKDQMDFLRTRNLGYKKDQVLVVPLNIKGGRYAPYVTAGMEASKKYKNELRALPEIMQVGVATHTMGTGGWTNVGYTDEKGIYRTFDLNSVDEDYIPAMQIKILKGRNFDKNIPSDQRRSVIINEAFAKEYNWSDPIGQRIPGANFPDHEVIGVVKDFNYNSLHTAVTPLAIVMNPGFILEGIENISIGVSPAPKLIISMHSNDLSNSVEKIHSIWDKLSNGEEFNFSFVDQTLDAQYKEDRHLGKIITYASILAILIGCLGLLGLASLNMTARIKEISLRKIMGASNKVLLTLLARDFLILIIIALIIAIPITYFIMGEWLNDFAFRISITPGFFLLAGGLSVLIALITIAYHAIKTALSNPVNTLRHE